jgi:hypothetical protein
MSWNLGYPEIRALPFAEALDALAANNAPMSIKDYVAAGIKALAARYGADVRVTVTGHGHLCDSATSFEVTTATLEVRKATEAEVADQTRTPASGEAARAT